MLIVEIAPQSNGAHRNQTGANIAAIPSGWAAVPQGMEAEALSYLPFIDLTITDGQITGIAQGVVPEPTPEPEPEPTTEDDLMEMAIDHEYRISLLEIGMTAI